MTQIKHGDFTNLAQSYIHRAGYSKLVLKNLLSYVGINDQSVIAEVGAGTGKCTECLLDFACVKNIIAIEPNDAMRTEGEQYILDKRVAWRKGSGEHTGLENKSVDYVIMASSFHWVDMAKGLTEFSRILKSHGYFTAIWNPRNIGESAFHQDIEQEIYKIAPDIKRVSSGSSEFTSTLFQKLTESGEFKDVVYVEARHNEVMTKERYLGIWHSVNDIRVQAGPDKWEKIMQLVSDIISDLELIEVPYLTRSWTVQKK